MKILIADDDSSMRSAIHTMVSHAGFDWIEASDGDQAIKAFLESQPDVVILDVMMPKLSGFEVCEQIRIHDDQVPILFLSAKGDIVVKKVGYKVGADDYIVKPFDEDELMLRLNVLLRRVTRKRDESEGVKSDEIEAQGLKINFRRHEVLVEGQKVELTPKEFQVLALLMEHPGEIFSSDELIESIWGEEYASEAISIAVYIRRIREKIEKNPSKPRYVQTVWRVGYRFGDAD